MQKKRNIVESGLERKGFRCKESHHHYFRYFTLEGKQSRVFTKTSHTSRGNDIRDHLLGQMARQCRISKRQFCDLIDCPIDQEEYEGMLRDQGLV